MPSIDAQTVQRAPQDATVASASGGSAYEAGSSTDLPPHAAPAASDAISACPAGRPVEGGSSSSVAGGQPDVSDLSVHLCSLLQAQKNALQPLVHASQHVATSFARELAPLMQMQLPSQTAGPQRPAPTFVPQGLQGELPMSPALRLLLEQQQQQLQQQQQQQHLQPVHQASSAQQQHASTSDAEGMLRRAEYAQQTMLLLLGLESHASNIAQAHCGCDLSGGSQSMPMPSSASFLHPPAFCTSSCQHVAQGPIDGVTAPCQDPGAAIPVQANVNPLPSAYGSGGVGAGAVDVASTNVPAPTQDPRPQGPRSA
jgi:hypothetical protein